MRFDLHNAAGRQMLLHDARREVQPVGIAEPPRVRAGVTDEFAAWLATDHGQAVWHSFVFFARQARAAGFKRFSARAIAERIRWQVSIETPSAGRFKLDDHHLPRLARKLMAEMPNEFAGFFETRELRT